MKKIVTIPDVYSKSQHEATIETGGNCIMIGLKGYGDSGSAPGHGAPIIIEFRDGAPFVLLWDDINDEEPSHLIDLSGAAENRRRQDDHQPAEIITP